MNDTVKSMDYNLSEERLRATIEWHKEQEKKARSEKNAVGQKHN